MSHHCSAEAAAAAASHNHCCLSFVLTDNLAALFQLHESALIQGGYFTLDVHGITWQHSRQGCLGEVVLLHVSHVLLHMMLSIVICLCTTLSSATISTVSSYSPGLTDSFGTGPCLPSLQFEMINATLKRLLQLLKQQQQQQQQQQL